MLALAARGLAGAVARQLPAACTQGAGLTRLFSAQPEPLFGERAIPPETPPLLRPVLHRLRGNIPVHPRNG